MAFLNIKTTADSSNINLIGLFTPDQVSYFQENGIDINWGDGSTTIDSFSHTYEYEGFYSINSTAFNAVSEIQNNFAISNIEYLKLSKFSNELTIGNNFLNNCSNLKCIDISEINVKSIGSNFLIGCNLDCVKLPYKEYTSLVSWGNNALSSNASLVAGIYEDYYKNTLPWSEKIDNIMKQEIEYEDTSESIIESKVGQFPLSQYGFLDLRYLPTLKNAVIKENPDIIPEESLTKYVNPDTKQVYYSPEDIKKEYFIYSFEYKFTFDNGVTFDKFYILNRYFKAIKLDGDLLYVNSFDNKTYFYYIRENDQGEDEDTDINFDTVNNKYLARDLLKDYAKSVYWETQRYKIREYEEREEPNYAMGMLKFGEVDENIVRNLNYDGDAETGIIIKIIASGPCKNLKIYSNNTNSQGEREFIWIRTDLFEGRSILKGDIITINTNIGQKSAKLVRNGEEYNILKYIDRTSTWLRIRHGSNPFFAKCDEQDGVFNLKINIYYNDKFEGI